MATTNVSIRMDENLKKQAETIFESMGMNITTAFTIFTKAVVSQGKIPFEITANNVRSFDFKPSSDVGCTPNADTIAFIKRVENGEEEMSPVFNTYEELKAWLDEDDDDE